MKKKIAIFLYKYFPYGGLQKDFMGVTKELLSRGHDVRIYTRSWQGNVPQGFNVITTGERGFSNYSKNKKYIDFAFKHIEKDSPDILLGFNKMPGLDLYFASDTCFAKQAKKKSVFQMICGEREMTFADYL